MYYLLLTAPLVDPKTGKKFTKYSGQVWYDSVGLSPDDRAKMYADRNRPLTLEEQLRDIDVERQRRQYEESVYKSRAGNSIHPFPPPSIIEQKES